MIFFQARIKPACVIHKNRKKNCEKADVGTFLPLVDVFNSCLPLISLEHMFSSD